MTAPSERGPVRRMFTSKIHRATVTGADVDYEGSVTIDRDLLDAAGATLALPALLWTGCSGGIHDVAGSPSSASSDLLVERPKELRPEAGHVQPPAGGTTVVSRDSSVAVVSEPVLSQLLMVDLKTKAVTKRIELRPGDNPGCCVEGAIAGEFLDRKSVV